ncbi:T9SS type A sorting domain-containing protein [Hymenobacter busanensis]|uniref:T9SS type A sorting domain-containing protein n=1 Tax=Hymenobacter busanensis TaxID=2607656 RepID=A0A7L4ZZ41_9BACT|nr:T9SS type A sorting domain-containing protein [Hymenobacter busanensis]KAA9332240.1 T9SS type A sorting domain-containing protein [Hymenobacter busanensis]QHJ07422.1 T9SS type A sorting domain-containing protein [Hymenobacter busanensis]
MMDPLRSFLRLMLLMLAPVGALAQPTTLNFSEHIAPIIYQHCTPCHRPGEVAPFSLTSYADVAARALTIKYVTGIRYMPPWKADPSYSHFLDENTLTQTQIDNIRQWVDAGAPRGNPALEPAVPTYPSGSQLGTPDLVVPMQQSYTHQGNNQDMYRVFVLPVTLPADRDVAAIEFRAGNKRIVHHAIVALDTTQRGPQRDALDPGYGYTQFGGFGFTPTEDNWAGYVPGSKPRYFPNGIGKKLYRRANLLLQIHYGPSATTQVDSSTINIFFSRQPVQRYVQTIPISVLQLTNGPFVIPANQVKTFRAEVLIPLDGSLLSVLPHAHLLGKSWKAWGVKPNGDSIKLIRINDWNFNWQGAYRFPALQHLVPGTRLTIEATYDNTPNNPRNPHDPPQQVTWGESTTDEMFVFYLDAIPYRAGDESMVLSAQSTKDLTSLGNHLYPVYPNPAGAEALHVGFTLARAAPVTLTLRDANGRVVRTLLRHERRAAGPHEVLLPAAQLSAGLYLLQLETGGFTQTQKVMVLGR